ncbi:integrase [Methanoplanus endosymbiosus]|uniref:Integrase SSV1 C-terminal domain-containing protein n=1 Tax=Methanoplanus endosymbiosus TaxID=33865 RepID=A0A9E7PKD4_9EURY|nr:integrase [Methanoplanus endosymbiosus]UUX91623.1 hypothetical protein L6E24_09595 [Methanoplanus endosymbiosus]
MSEARKKDYINGLLKLPDIRNIADLLKLKLTDSQTKGLRVFIHFMEDVIGFEKILNINPDKWLKSLKIKTSQPKITFFNDHDLEEAYPLIPVNLQTFFKLAAYTGARGIHLFRALQDFKPENIQTDGDNPEVSFYPVTDAGRGNKSAFVLYFPSSFVDELKSYELPHQHPSTILKGLQDAGMPVKNLRKWHANLLLKHGVQESIVDYLQSRTSRTVIGRHYANLHMQACRAYSQTIQYFPEFTG